MPDSPPETRFVVSLVGTVDEKDLCHDITGMDADDGGRVAMKRKAIPLSSWRRLARFRQPSAS